jgi:hypothetical protein
MIDVRFRPMSDPRTHKSRKSAAFRVTYSRTLDLLETELRWLRASDVVIEAGCLLSQIRNDGWPRSSARPDHPAVRLSFRAKGKSIAFPCDTYDSMDDNLRAIALTLESLRAIDRYAVTQDSEQYKGWMALPAPGTGPMTREEAAQFLVTHGSSHVSANNTDPEAVRHAYRNAAKSLHPDSGGTHEQFTRLQEAVRVLEASR